MCGQTRKADTEELHIRMINCPMSVQRIHFLPVLMLQTSTEEKIVDFPHLRRTKRRPSTPHRERTAWTQSSVGGSWCASFAGGLYYY
jgi:hypothetical protein